jgi:hypothetical protein
MKIEEHIVERGRLETIIYKLINKINLNEKEKEVIDNILGKK